MFSTRFLIIKAIDKKLVKCLFDARAMSGNVSGPTMKRLQWPVASGTKDVIRRVGVETCILRGHRDWELMHR